MKKAILYLLIVLPSALVVAQCWQSVSSGSTNYSFHNLGIQVDGTLWGWGLNSSGQLGDGTTTNRLVPTQIGTDNDWIAIAAGSNSSYAIKQNGTLWAWGGNDEGQLSNNSNIGRLTPAQVLPGTTWSKISAGERFVVAVKSDGTLWSCGYGQDSQLGFNDAASLYEFTQNTTVTGWESIHCGFRHTVLVKSDHTIWGFGESDLGKLATGSQSVGLGIPSQLPLLPNGEWTHAIAGANTSMFRKNDGTLWGVGQNNLGTLGNGATVFGVYPLTQSGTATDWLSIEDVSIHSLALKNNGTLWASGVNTTGQLGIGTTANTSSFVQVGTASHWAKVRCGRQHTLAITNTGTLWTWGLNSSGQLGDGTTTQRTTPVRIGTECNLSTPSYDKKVMRLLNNPVHEQAQLLFANDGVKQLQVFSLQGQVVLQKTTTDDFTYLDASGLTSGVYFISCKSDVGNQTIKMVKQ